MREERIATVENCLVRIQPGGARVLQSRDYRPSGRYPIIDQGQALIGGWTDDPTDLISDELPVIVFGDHTRTLKFVDFPFVRGADGTQILKPKPDIDPLFFYYALRAVDLPSRGYNRHFKALKEKEISIPEGTEQIDIARVLRLTEAVLGHQEKLLNACERAKHAAMQTLLARGLRGEMQKETEIGLTPESWDVSTLEHYAGRPDYGYTASAATEPVGPKFLRITDIQDGSVNWDTVPFCDCDSATMREKQLRPGDIVVARIGATTGKAFLVKVAPIAVFASYMLRVRTRPSDLLPEFLYYYMQGPHYWQHIDRNKGGRLKEGVNIPVLLSLPVPIPTLEEQSQIVAILDAIERKLDLHRRKRSVLAELFKALLHRLTTGEIRVADLELSALTATPATTETPA